jgi:hypothetical protein
VLGYLASRRHTHSTTQPPAVQSISPLARPFHDFFESPTDPNTAITRASFEPFTARGLPLLLQANLVSEVKFLPSVWAAT